MHYHNGWRSRGRPILVLILASIATAPPSCASNLTQENAPAAWTVRSDCSPVIIVDIGNGVQTDHPALASNIPLNPGVAIPGYPDIRYGWDFYDDDNLVAPDAGDPSGAFHDTFATGIMAGNGTNGAYGVCHTANVLVLKKHLADAYADPTVVQQAAAAINFATAWQQAYSARAGRNVPMVINNSYPVLIGAADWARYGGPLQAAISNASAHSILMFFAATNSSQSQDNAATAAYPAAYPNPNLVQVAAVDASDRLTRISNYGASVQIAAPSVNTCGPVLGGGYATDPSGSNGFTSYATPNVTAAAALYWSQNPGASPAQVVSALLSSADHIAGLPVMNGNRLNIGRLMGAVSAPQAASASGTTIPSASRIVDAGGAVWTLVGDGAAIDGKADGSHYMKAMLYYNGSIYIEDTGNSWWQSRGPFNSYTQIGADPRGAPAPGGPRASRISGGPAPLTCASAAP